MANDEWLWAEKLEEPLTGDLSSAIAEICAVQVRDNPRSVFAYALWKAVLELDDLFGEEQGIEAAQFERLQENVREPLKRLVQGGLREGTSGQWEALADLVAALRISKGQSRSTQHS